jgi:FixJ family two-component response regulator
MTTSPTVYVVDDDEAVRKALTRLLAVSGFGVRAFASAQDFLAAPLSSGPQCLLLDLQLPGLNGLDLQAAFAPAHRVIPIIFLTGHGSVPDCVQALRRGAVDFLLKPVDADRLLAAVRQAIELSRSEHVVDDARQAIMRRLEALTRREREVLELVVTGMLNKQIAYGLSAAEKTIKVHRARVMAKMQAKSVPDLVRMLHALGIDTAGPVSAAASDQSPTMRSRRQWPMPSEKPGESRRPHREGAPSVSQAANSDDLRY